MNDLTQGGPPVPPLPPPPPPPPPILPIDLTPAAAEVAAKWIDRHYATKEKKLELDQRALELDVQIEREESRRSYWLLVGILIALGSAATGLYLADDVNYAILLMTHAATFFAGSGTKWIFERRARAVAEASPEDE